MAASNASSGSVGRVRLQIGVDEAAGENRAGRCPANHRILRVRCDRVAEVGPVEDVDEFAADVKVVLAFLADPEMAADIGILAGHARPP